jgi:hypothetical protein
LAIKLRSCGERLRLTCSNCGVSKEVEKGCRQKWCPVCVRRIAARRSDRYRLAVGMMEWPLFVTLTIPPHETDHLGDLRRLRRGFGKLRRTKTWRAHVKGGVAGLEVSSRSGAFHPHLHTVCDCRWLSAYVRPPQRGDGKATIKAKCLAASEELGLSWAKCLGVKSLDPDWLGVIYKVKRTSGEDITSEILKYSVKGADLCETKEPIGPIIRALQATRLVTSYGNCHGKERADDSAVKQPRPCSCCGVEAWVTEWEEEAATRDTRDKMSNRIR